MNILIDALLAAIAPAVFSLTSVYVWVKGMEYGMRQGVASMKANPFGAPGGNSVPLRTTIDWETPNGTRRS